MEFDDVNTFLDFLYENWDKLIKNQNSDLSRKADSLVPECFFGTNGPTIDVRDFVTRKGFYVRPGEQDKFGWLTGVIYRKGRPESEFFLYG